MEQNMLNKFVRRKPAKGIAYIVGVVYRDTGNGIVGIIVTHGPGSGTRTTWAKSELHVL